MKYKTKDGRDYISYHAIERFAERILKGSIDVTVLPEIEKIGSFMEKMLDEHYPMHLQMKSNCKYIFKDYGIEMVKTDSGRIATVTEIKTEPGHDPEYNIYIKEKRRVRNGITEKKYNFWTKTSRR